MKFFIIIFAILWSSCKPRVVDEHLTKPVDEETIHSLALGFIDEYKIQTVDEYVAEHKGGLELRGLGELLGSVKSFFHRNFTRATKVEMPKRGVLDWFVGDDAQAVAQQNWHSFFSNPKAMRDIQANNLIPDFNVMRKGMEGTEFVPHGRHSDSLVFQYNHPEYHYWGVITKDLDMQLFEEGNLLTIKNDVLVFNGAENVGTTLSESNLRAVLRLFAAKRKIKLTDEDLSRIVKQILEARVPRLAALGQDLKEINLTRFYKDMFNKTDPGELEKILKREIRGVCETESDCAAVLNLAFRHNLGSVADLAYTSLSREGRRAFINSLDLDLDAIFERAKTQSFPTILDDILTIKKNTVVTASKTLKTTEKTVVSTEIEIDLGRKHLVDFYFEKGKAAEIKAILNHTNTPIEAISVVNNIITKPSLLEVFNDHEYMKALLSKQSPQKRLEFYSAISDESTALKSEKTSDLNVVAAVANLTNLITLIKSMQ